MCHPTERRARGQRIPRTACETRKETGRNRWSGAEVFGVHRVDELPELLHDLSLLGNLTLFGFIKLGSFSQGAYGSSVEKSSDSSSFTVTFTPSPELVAQPQALKKAFVIAGAVANPGA